MFIVNRKPQLYTTLTLHSERTPSSKATYVPGTPFRCVYEYDSKIHCHTTMQGNPPATNVYHKKIPAADSVNESTRSYQV